VSRGARFTLRVYARAACPDAPRPVYFAPQFALLVMSFFFYRLGTRLYYVYLFSHWVFVFVSTRVHCNVDFRKFAMVAGKVKVLFDYQNLPRALAQTSPISSWLLTKDAESMGDWRVGLLCDFSMSYFRLRFVFKHKGQRRVTSTSNAGRML